MSRMLQSLFMGVRNLFVRGVVRDLDDSGANQTLTVDTHVGRTRTQVPVYQIYGLASHVPHDGAITVMLHAGGDHSDPIALPPSNPEKARMGNLAEGETVLYDSVGQKIFLQGGKIVMVDAAQQMLVRVAGQPVLTVTEDGASVQGDLSVSGDVTSGGTVTGKKDVMADAISLKNHTHTSGEPGSPTSAPTG